VKVKHFNPLAEWKAAARSVKQHRNKAQRVEVVIAKAHQSADQVAKQQATPTRPESGGALFDGKEIKDGLGRIVGRWRYQGGGFRSVYFP
jgi:hypothetical protein